MQKKGNSKSGSEMQRDKEMVAQKMREKQAAGKVLVLASIRYNSNARLGSRCKESS